MHTAGFHEGVGLVFGVLRFRSTLCIWLRVASFLGSWLGNSDGGVWIDRFWFGGRGLGYRQGVSFRWWKERARCICCGLTVMAVW